MFNTPQYSTYDLGLKFSAPHDHQDFFLTHTLVAAAQSWHPKLKKSGIPAQKKDTSPEENAEQGLQGERNRRGSQKDPDPEEEAAKDPPEKKDKKKKPKKPKPKTSLEKPVAAPQKLKESKGKKDKDKKQESEKQKTKKKKGKGEVKDTGKALINFFFGKMHTLSKHIVLLF